MKPTLILLAGAVLAFAPVLAANGQLSEEQYKTKYGRSTPAAEARLKNAGPVKVAAEPADCCRTLPQKGLVASANQRLNEERIRAKYGLFDHAKVVRDEHVRDCLNAGQCERPDSSRPVAAKTATTAFLETKFGRRPAVKAAEPLLSAMSTPEQCPHQCCHAAG